MDGLEVDAALVRQVIEDVGGAHGFGTCKRCQKNTLLIELGQSEYFQMCHRTFQLPTPRSFFHYAYIFKAFY